MAVRRKGLSARERMAYKGVKDADKARTARRRLRYEAEAKGTKKRDAKAR